MNADPDELVIHALESAGSRVRGRDGRWMANCPAHDDRTPSLSVMRFRDDNVWVHCFAGCETERVLDRLGLRFADLFARRLLAAAGPDVLPGQDLPPAWANPLARDVLDVLHDHAFNGPHRPPVPRTRCRGNPGQARLAHHPRNGQPHVRWLRRYGFIDWHQERAPGSKWRHNAYGLRCTWVRPLREALLARLNRIKGRSTSVFTASNPFSPLPVPFSVIRPHEHDWNGRGNPGSGW
jgi:hypothetical protein